MSNREASIQQLTALKEKLNRIAAIDKSIGNSHYAPHYSPLSQKELLPTNNADTYLQSKTPSRLDIADRKALIVKILFWVISVLAVVITGIVTGKSIYEGGVYEPLICPAVLVVSVVVAFLDIKFDWDRKILILVICIIVAIAMAGQTHKYFGFSFWIFFGVVALAAGLIALCMHFDGFSDFFYGHNKKLDKLEDWIRQTKEYQDMVELDHQNIKENKKIEHDRRAAFEQRVKQRNAQLEKEIAEYRQQKKALEQEIRNNDILAPGDLPKIDRILQKLTSYRADSIKEALQQCDQEDYEMQKYQMERADRQLQESLNRLERDRRIQQESDAAFNQAMHNMRMEREQRRQTEELERIRRELENT